MPKYLEFGSKILVDQIPWSWLIIIFYPDPFRVSKPMTNLRKISERPKTTILNSLAFPYWALIMVLAHELAHEDFYVP